MRVYVNGCSGLHRFSKLQHRLTKGIIKCLQYFCSHWIGNQIICQTCVKVSNDDYYILLNREMTYMYLVLSIMWLFILGCSCGMTYDKPRHSEYMVTLTSSHVYSVIVLYNIEMLRSPVDTSPGIVSSGIPHLEFESRFERRMCINIGTCSLVEKMSVTPSYC